MPIALRPACAEDFDFCAELYFAEMRTILQELKLDMDRHAAGFRQQWELTQVRIITLDGVKIGWLQSFIRDEALFLAQIFIEGSFQRRGIGTEVMNRLIREAACSGRATTLAVVKTNPAFRLYERLGFRVTHADERKFYMKLDPETGSPPT
jgi:ribosomal protein S18 acetylase RimI-like enzyme